MENTSKALLIAAAVLVAIIIIAFGIKIFSSSSKASETAIDVGKTIEDKTELALASITSATGTSISGSTTPTNGEFNNNNNEGIENMSLQQGQTATVNSPYISDGKKAIIPAGYTVSNVEGETSIDNGLVIRKDGNEWVWIPVSSADLAAMYTENATGWTMSGTEVVTKYKSLGDRISDPYGSIRRDNPGSSSYREPDVLEDDDDEEYLSQAGLGANIREAATKLRDDYKEMIDSVKKNGGFYIGRYELSNAGTKKNQPSLYGINWYKFYKACRDIEGSSNYVVTTMIFGCQWDQVCKFISTAKVDGEPISLTDSRKYGNYSNSQAPANTGNYVQYQKQNTGSNEAWKTNNIYDLAGNYSEWTQEAVTTITRVHRGGHLASDGAQAPVTRRGSYYQTMDTTRMPFTSRPVLYIK